MEKKVIRDLQGNFASSVVNSPLIETEQVYVVKARFMKKIENNPHEQTLVINQTEGYKLNQKLNELIWEG